MTTTTAPIKKPITLSLAALRILRVAATTLGRKHDNPIWQGFGDAARVAVDAAWWAVFPGDESTADVLARYRQRARPMFDSSNMFDVLASMIDRSLFDEVDDGDTDLVDLVGRLVECAAEAATFGDLDEDDEDLDDEDEDDSDEDDEPDDDRIVDDEADDDGPPLRVAAGDDYDD